MQQQLSYRCMQGCYCGSYRHLHVLRIDVRTGVFGILSSIVSK